MSKREHDDLPDESDYAPEEESERDDAKDLQAIARAEPVREAYLISATEFLALARDEPDWLIRGAIPAGAITYFGGRPGCGKSWLAFDLAVAIAQGRQWLDFPAPDAPASVLIFSLDSPTPMSASRFRRLGLLPTDPVTFHAIGVKRPSGDLPSTLMLPEALTAIDHVVAAERPRLIVIDSLRKIHHANESDSAEMVEITNALRWLTSGGAAVVCVHHVRKPAREKDGGGGDDDGLELRGSTEIEASADCIIMVKDGLCRWSKTRDWLPDGEGRDGQLERTWSVGASRVECGPSLATVLASGPMARSEIARALGVGQRAAAAIVSRAIAEGIVRECRRGDPSDPRRIELRQ